MIKVTILSDGGTDTASINGSMLSTLAENIQRNGHEIVHLSGGRSIKAVGIMITGKEMGERIILTGQKSGEDTHGTSK